MRILKRSNTRTALLAIFAAASFAYAAVEYFDVPPGEMLEYFLLSALLLVVMMALAGLLVWLLVRLRR